MVCNKYYIDLIIYPSRQSVRDNNRKDIIFLRSYLSSESTFIDWLSEDSSVSALVCGSAVTLVFQDEEVLFVELSSFLIPKDDLSLALQEDFPLGRVSSRGCCFFCVRVFSLRHTIKQQKDMVDTVIYATYILTLNAD